MLFFVTHRYKSGFTHEDQKAMLKIWENFQPPAGFETKMHTFAPDGRMFGFIESESIEAVYEVCTLWAGVFIDYEVVPVIDVEDSLPLMRKAIATREE